MQRPNPQSSRGFSPAKNEWHTQKILLNSNFDQSMSQSDCIWSMRKALSLAI